MNKLKSPATRKYNPIISNIVEYKIVRDIVIRDVTLDTNGETIAKIMSGIVVKMPATLLLISITCLISSTTGPTDVSGARKVEAINTIAKITPQFSLILCTRYGSVSLYHLPSKSSNIIIQDRQST